MKARKGRLGSGVDKRHHVAIYKALCVLLISSKAWGIEANLICIPSRTLTLQVFAKHFFFLPQISSNLPSFMEHLNKTFEFFTYYKWLPNSLRHSLLAQTDIVNKHIVQLQKMFFLVQSSNIHRTFGILRKIVTMITVGIHTDADSKILNIVVRLHSLCSCKLSDCFLFIWSTSFTVFALLLIWSVLFVTNGTS